ncbi:Tyrosine-protein kinase STK [Geodia barretti]|uniref:Tyrosine-protein kinase STK n=1 Tax=Geodia barretti TaxID=519541 RepID=A0AA35T4P9_GEOBA|nr:Tyrosine-protein kinase STK [Geodia barretti]
MAAKFFLSFRRANYSQLRTVESSLPANATPRSTSSLSLSTWYFGDLSHVKAEELLSRPGLRSGTFLVRKSSSCPGSFALSVLNQGKVFHYLIIGDSSGGVYVGLTSERKVLNTMEELVTYYRSGSNFLVCKLTDSCPKSSVDSASLEIERSSLVLRERLSSSGSDDMWYGIWTREGRKLPVHVRRLSPQLYSKTDVIHETDMTRQTVCSLRCFFLQHIV